MSKARSAPLRTAKSVGQAHTSVLPMERTLVETLPPPGDQLIRELRPAELLQLVHPAEPGATPQNRG